MSVSNEERREIAAKLRALEPWAHFGTSEPITREEVEGVLGFEYSIGDSYDAAGIRRLADLIDRPTCRNVYDEIYDEYEGGCCENGFKCSKCGELVEDCEGYRIKGTFNYCPKCGREVVSE